MEKQLYILNGQSQEEQAMRARLKAELDNLGTFVRNEIKLEKTYGQALADWHGEPEPNTEVWNEHDREWLVEDIERTIIEKVQAVPIEFAVLKYFEGALEKKKSEVQAEKASIQALKNGIKDAIPPEFVTQNWNMPERQFVRQLKEKLGE